MNSNVMKTNKTFRTFFVMLLAMAIIFTAGCKIVHAANVCKEIHGSTRGDVTFTVKTDKGWLNNQYIKLKGSKGVLSYTNWFGTEKTMKRYGCYNVVIINTKTGERTEKEWKDGSIKIKLKKNSTYTIRVSPWSLSSLQARYFWRGAINGWVQHATWKVNKTKHCTFCQY